jgi:Double zinc ribbon
VNYCQECGASNTPDAVACRICGVLLTREEGGPPCHTCGAPTAAGAGFCSSCGAAIRSAADALSTGALPGSLKVDAAVAAERQAAAARLGAALNLGDGLELPDWLQRAAAEQPFDPARQSAVASIPFGPIAAATATLESPTAMPATSGGQIDIASEAAAHPPLSIPAPGLASSIPAWLQDPPGADATPAQSASAAPTPEPDVADTGSFISESDLPEWIRQLAAADEAKQAEAERLAAEARGDDDPAGGRHARPLPGETAASGPTASPWLARRERGGVAESVAADTWTGSGVAAPVADAGPAREPLAATTELTEAAPAIAKATPEVDRGSPAPRARPLRLVLAAAIVLVILALLAFVVLS